MGEGERPAPVEPDPRLAEVLHIEPDAADIAPSREADPEHGGDGGGSLLRGQVIHRLLQLACEGEADPPARAARETGLDPHDPSLEGWWDEARRVLENPDFADLFDPARYRKAWNEVPVQYRDGARLVAGRIDRLVMQADGLYLVDYKTHPLDDETALRALVEDYRPQMRLYREAVRRLWPDRPVRAGLLFTWCGRLLEIGTKRPD